MSKRYALYFAPADDTPLALFAQSVLGRTATSPRTLVATSTYPDRERWLTLTSSPAHYGFHATLKAPFELASDRTAIELCEQVEHFATQQKAVALPGLFPRTLAGFNALTLARQPEPLNQLALRIVEHFEHFRLPLSDDDIQRRKKQPLTTRQLQLLEQFGYPYVADEFRFHMTLTGSICKEHDQDYILWLEQCFKQQVIDTPALDQLAIYCQDNRKAPFVRLHSFPLLAN